MPPRKLLNQSILSPRLFVRTTVGTGDDPNNPLSSPCTARFPEANMGAPLGMWKDRMAFGSIAGATADQRLATPDLGV
eukprot:1564472-Rhodomonas_salina.3